MSLGWHALLFACLCAFSAGRANADEPVARAEPAQEVTVRGAEPARSASGRALDQRELQAAPHRNASELLLSVPGVFVSQHSGEGKAHQIFFRGFDAVHGQDVEIGAGGAPVNEVSNVHGQGYADLHFLIPEVVRRIRSTPGTYDPRQGDFAVAGSLDFDLGYAEPGVTAQAEFGSFGTRRFFLGYHPEGADPATFGAFELAATDGFGPSRAARHASGMGQAVHDFGGGLRARVLGSAYAGRFDSAGVLRESDIDAGRVDRFATYDPKQGGHSSRTGFVLELRKSAGEGESDGWSLQPYAVFRSLGLRSNFTGSLTSGEGDSIQQLNDATTLGMRGHYRRTLLLLSQHDALEAGVSLRTDAIHQTQHRLSSLNDRVTDDIASPGVDADVRATNAAGYVDAELHPIRRVTLRGGLRMDGLSYLTEEKSGQTRSAAGAQLSKRGTLDVNVLRGLNALVSYGEGFRSPQARSLGQGETTPFTRVTSYEAGLRFHDAARFQASIAGYRTSLSDDLVFDPATARNELVPGTVRQGVALNLAARPKDWFLSNTSFTYARASFDASGGGYVKGALLPFVPQIVVRSDMALTPRLGGVFGRELRSHFGAGTTYLGRRPLPYSEFGHDVFLIDARAEFRVGPVATGLEVFNLLDADWYDGQFVYASDFGGGGSRLPVRHVTVGPPRSFHWSFTLFV